MGLNRVELIGGLTRPPELKYTTGGWPFVTFTLAVNDTRYDRDAKAQVPFARFIACQMWGERAEQAAAELEHARGEELYVLGELDQSEWEDADGKKQSRTRVKVHRYDRLNPKTDRQPTTNREPEQPFYEPNEDPF